MAYTGIGGEELVGNEKPEKVILYNVNRHLTFYEAGDNCPL